MELLRVLPKNYLSYFVGKLVHLRLPRPLNRKLISWFAGRYGCRIEEATRPLEDYRSLGEFFQRDLQPDARPIGEGAVSPVDGTLTEHGPIENGALLQVKDRSYDVGELLASRELGKQFDGGYYITFYLAPGDYHHIHSPVSGAITQAVHIEGALWPVNEWSLHRIDRLFCRNERIITFIESDYGTVAVVKVGATNVGSIVTTYAPLCGNLPPRFNPRTRERTRLRFQAPIPVAKGDRIGSFRMGSSVVVLFEKGRFRAGEGCVRGPVRFGRTLSRIKVEAGAREA